MHSTSFREHADCTDLEFKMKRESSLQPWTATLSQHQDPRTSFGGGAPPALNHQMSCSVVNTSACFKRRYSPSIAGSSKHFPRDFFNPKAVTLHNQNELEGDVSLRARVSSIEVEDEAMPFGLAESVRAFAAVHERKGSSSQMPVRANHRIENVLREESLSKSKQGPLRDISNIVENNNSCLFVRRKHFQQTDHDSKVTKVAVKDRLDNSAKENNFSSLHADLEG